MLQVPIDKIMPVTDARANISKVVDDVENGDIYVLTRGGKPTVVMVSVEYITKLTEKANNQNSDDEKPDNKKSPKKNNHLITTDEINVLPVKVDEVETEPVVYEEKPTDIVEKDATPSDSDVGDGGRDEEQSVPIKISH